MVTMVLGISDNATKQELPVISQPNLNESTST